MRERQIIGVKKRNGRRKNAQPMWQGNSVNRDKTSQPEQQATHDPLVGEMKIENVVNKKFGGRYVVGHSVWFPVSG